MFFREKCLHGSAAMYSAIAPSEAAIVSCRDTDRYSQLGRCISSL